jgi:hypothetical protein
LQVAVVVVITLVLGVELEVSEQLLIIPLLAILLTP